MTVFNTFLKVLNKNKFIIIMYTVILIAFGGFNLKNSDTSTNFEASKPNILIVNKDGNIGITKSLIDYLTINSNISLNETNEESINDALFYRDINYVIYLPKNFREDFLNKKNPQIEIKTTGDYQASLAEMMLNRFMNIANTYNQIMDKEEDVIKNINKTLENQTEVEITSNIDTNELSKATFYFNFASYSILAGCVYIICLILSSFKDEKIMKRTIISSMNYKKINRDLLLFNGLFAIVLWLLYCIVGIILLGNIMFTIQGLIYIINALIFTLVALSLAFLIGNLITNKNAINGIVNVIALGSSFLCGAFVPAEYLPDSVLKLAHLLPSYYYINSNEILKTIEEFNFINLKPIIFNSIILILFIIIFVILANIISRKKRKIA